MEEKQKKGSKTPLIIALVLVVAVVVGLVALLGANNSKRQEAADKAGLNESQKALVSEISKNKQEMDDAQKEKEKKMSSISADYEKAEALVKEYKKLSKADAEGEKGAQIKAEIAALIGADADYVEKLLES